MSVYTVVGARPQFIKTSVVSRTLRRRGIGEVIVHTGQHYDAEMSRIFFEELQIAAPEINLEVGSGSHAGQTAEMMTRLEELLAGRGDVDWVMVYGDTNSTLAAALTAVKLNLPLAHVEAGLRSFNRRMPEEINRVIADRLARLLFCPTQSARDHLAAEGIEKGVVLSGDVMLEAVQLYGNHSEERISAGAAPGGAQSFGVRSASSSSPGAAITYEPGAYYLATVHRAENTDDPVRLEGILTALSRLDRPVVFPLHPRTRKKIDARMLGPNVEPIEPQGYPAMLRLIRGAARVLTDSGGIQKESYWLGVPCVTLRDETEWVETLQNDWNRLAGADPDAICDAATKEPTGRRGRFGHAPAGLPSEWIADALSRPAPTYDDLASTTPASSRTHSTDA